jgi:hypothetical protein
MVRWTKLANVLEAAGATGFTFDGEPYGLDGDNPLNSPWCVRITNSVAYEFGHAIGALAASKNFEIFGYSSSGGSWVGSNNDEIHLQQPGVTESSYTNNKYAHFIEGMSDGIGDPSAITLTDASFHHGVQNTNASGDWPTGIEIVNDRTESRFPGVLASIMFGSDPTPPNNFFDPDYMGYVAGVSVTYCTGYCSMYHHNLFSGDWVSYWNQVLDAIAATL